MPELLIEQPDQPPRTLKLVNPVCKVGRVKSNDISIAGDTAISREHCRFDVTPQGVLVSDMGSSNGTLVNSKRIGTERVLLRAGDRVQVGSTIITLDPDGLDLGDRAGNGGVATDASPTHGPDKAPPGPPKVVAKRISAGMIAAARAGAAQAEVGERIRGNTAPMAPQPGDRERTAFGEGFIVCGRCGNRLETKAKAPGAKVGCPRCRAVYVIPRPGETPPKQDVASKPAPKQENGGGAAKPESTAASEDKKAAPEPAAPVGRSETDEKAKPAAASGEGGKQGASDPDGAAAPEEKNGGKKEGDGAPA